jgi:hypothetical protein
MARVPSSTHRGFQFLGVAKDAKYDPLLSSGDNADAADELEHADDTTSRSNGKGSRTLRAIWKVLVVCLTIVSITSLSYNMYSAIKARPRSCSCGGTTVAEAKRRGCIFTPLAISWLPPHCIDMELANDFDSANRASPDGQWKYYADPNTTVEMTREEVSMLADVEGAVFYTTQDWHITHCVYTWMKHYRSKTSTGVTIENRSNGMKHIRHCEGILRLGFPLQQIATQAGIELNADLS